MQREACFQLGQLVRKVGHDGRLLLEFDVDDPRVYKALNAVFVELNNTLVPFFIQSIRWLNKTQAHVKLEDVDNDEQSATLLGCAVFLPLEMLPELTGNQFYYHEVIGFEVQNPSGLLAGIITDILENGPNDLFRLDQNGREVLIPVADHWIISVDRINRRIIMEWPDGLLELNS